MRARVAFNIALFGLLLAGIGVFTQSRRPSDEPMILVVTAIIAAVWAGTLVALSEGQPFTVPSRRRAGRSALLGALAYVGLFSALTMLATVEMRPSFVLLGAVVGAMSHGLRSLRASAAYDEAGVDNDGDGADDVGDDVPAS